MLKGSFLEYLRFGRNCSECTVSGYGKDLDEFEKYFKTKDEALTFVEVDSDIVRGWVMSLADEGYKATSINRKLSALRSFYRYLLTQKIVSKDPMRKVKGPKEEKKLPVFIRESDMDRLLGQLDSSATFQEVRDRMILEFLYETGVRVSELVALRDADVDFGRGQVKVLGKRNKNRYIPFGDELKRDLLTYLSKRDETFSGSETLFVSGKGLPMKRNAVYLIVRRDLSKVVTLKKKSPHVLRHTFATSMLNHQAELEAVKELLGHESLDATQVYTHNTFEELKKVYEQAHPRA